MGKWTKTRLRFQAAEPLEARLMLASQSVGWDGPGPGSAELTYFIGNGPSYLDQADVIAALETALGVWAEVVDIQFIAASRPNLRDSIDLEFGRIDGPGKALAEAYFPDDVNRGRTAGDVLFDTSEQWEIGNSLGRAATDLLLVAVHEIGHALGLEHSDARGSVMAESVSPNQSFRGLAAADVDAVLTLYAPAVEDILLRGDFNGNGNVDVADVNSLLAELASESPDVRFDLTGDNSVDGSDRDEMIRGVLGTNYGDANLDGAFNITDLVHVLQAGMYGTADRDVTWADGDWDGDGVFGAKDMVLALQSGAYGRSDFIA